MTALKYAADWRRTAPDPPTAEDADPLGMVTATVWDDVLGEWPVGDVAWFMVARSPVEFPGWKRTAGFVAKNEVKA